MQSAPAPAQQPYGAALRTAPAPAVACVRAPAGRADPPWQTPLLEGEWEVTEQSTGGATFTMLIKHAGLVGIVQPQATAREVMAHTSMLHA